MASTPSKTDQDSWPGRRVSYVDFVSALEQRKAALGSALSVSRNAGTTRTPSKRAMLKAIEELGGNW
jgi:hypothetical protein